MGSNNAYMRKYLLKRYYARIKEAHEILGNKCHCGATSDLEIDHIDRNLKSFTLTQLWSCSKKKFLEELSKCQLLCNKCHKKKTLKDLNRKDARLNHGTLSSYRYCKCVLCKKAHSEYMKQYYLTRGR